MSQVKKIVTDTVRATFHLLDPNRRLNSFELFGYDFMFDDQFRPYLIEVNSNPCLEESSKLLSKLFTEMIDSTFRLTVDALFPPPPGFVAKKSSNGIDYAQVTKYDLIFD